MKLKFASAVLAFIFGASLLAVAQDASADGPQQGGDFSSNPNAIKVPQDVILVKGAEPSASDASTPVPEGGDGHRKSISRSRISDGYQLPAGWSQKYVGPPPSDSGYYVLAQIEPGKGFKGEDPGTILISAQDLFFSLSPAKNAVELINFPQEQVEPEYKVERPPRRS